MISKAAADAALDLLLAARCAGCGAAGAWLCLACRELCEPVRHGRVTAAGTYGGALREAIHHFKYGGERALANELGELVAACVAKDLATGVALDVVDEGHARAAKRTCFRDVRAAQVLGARGPVERDLRHCEADSAERHPQR